MLASFAFTGQFILKPPIFTFLFYLQMIRTQTAMSIKSRVW